MSIPSMTSSSSSSSSSLSSSSSSLSSSSSSLSSSSSSSSSVNQAAISVFSGTPSPSSLKRSSDIDRKEAFESGYEPLQNSQKKLSVIFDIITHHYKPKNSSVFDPIEKLRTILKDPNEVKKLFQLALQKKYTALLELLASEKIDIDKEDINEALIFFSKEEITQEPVIERLIERGADVDTALIHALHNLKTVKLLLKHNAKMNIHTAVRKICLKEKNLQAELTKLLITNHTDLNLTDESGDTALTIASSGFGNKDIALMLLEQGANPDIQTKDGYTALALASYTGKLSIVKKILTTTKNSLNLQNENGDSPLILAVRLNHLEIVKILLRNKADKNIQNNNKETALSIAKQLTNEESGKEESDDEETTPMIAKASNNQEIITLLSKDYTEELIQRTPTKQTFVTNQLKFLSESEIEKLKPNDPIHSIIRNFHALMKETFSESEKETINDNLYKIKKISEQKRAHYKSRFGFLKELFSKLGNLFNRKIRRFISSGDLGLELVRNWEGLQKHSAES